MSYPDERKLRDMWEDPEWEKQRVVLQETCLAAALALASHTFAASMSFASESLEITVKVKQPRGMAKH